MTTGQAADWDGVAPQRVLAGPGAITTIAGLTFAISDERGDIGPGPFGLITDDTRHLSRLQVQLNSAPLRHLGSGLVNPATAHFRGYATLTDRLPDAPIECERLRELLPGRMVETLTLRCWRPDPVQVHLSIQLDADFADIFQVRRLAGDPRVQSSGIPKQNSPGCLCFQASGSRRTTSVRMEPPADIVGYNFARWALCLRRDQPWVLRIEVSAHRGSGNEERIAVRPRIETVGRPDVVVQSLPERLARGCLRSLTDLDALSIPDERNDARRLLAAGIPWFVALFGRDALISSYQARAFRPELILDTLVALAARQGRVHDPGNEEQPGKILHEVRFGDRLWLGEGTTGGTRPYYGSADSTPLFLIMLGEALRWGAPREALIELLPAARAALGWLRGPGDPDRDGLIEYAPTGPRSLVNQGWKDSENAVQFADGQLATPPIAIVEVQGYAYRARRELAAVLSHLGHHSEADDLIADAKELRELIRRRYWQPSADGRPGSFALALDHDKRQVDSITSNMAHLLWCGVPSPQEAEQVASQLASPAMSSGWGLRTLSTDMAGYNPISYHLGSVWPHDTLIACEGLRHYGLDDVAMRLVGELLDALAIFDDRLPELFGGHRREPDDFPVPYPTACRPQAWAAGVPLAIVALCLGLQPDVPARTVTLNPALPKGLHRLEVHGIPFPEGELSISHDGDTTIVIETPPGLRVTTPR
ncbi:MAG TPA: glycogen debranching N-terminal domain-containing protein [Pseudonocardiaceae bacterium]|jgi:glycogen debranching enzyme|nr:glycogen debranching N-terminal domain-containing protein [Pseudonocardiaceae bacterium]